MFARLAMGFANVRAGTLESTNAGAGAGHADGAPLEARFQHMHHISLDPRNESRLYVSDVECWDDDRCDTRLRLPPLRANAPPCALSTRQIRADAASYIMCQTKQSCVLHTYATGRYPDDQKYRPCASTDGGVCGWAPNASPTPHSPRRHCSWRAARMLKACMSADRGDCFSPPLRVVLLVAVAWADPRSTPDRDRGSNLSQVCFSGVRLVELDRATGLALGC